MENNLAFLQSLERLINILKKYWDYIEIDSAGLWSDKGWDSPPDRLKAFENSLILEGSADLHMNNRKYKAKKGQLYFTDISLGTYCECASFKMYYITFHTHHTEAQQLLSSCFSMLSACLQSNVWGHTEEHFLGIISETLFNRPFAHSLTHYHMIALLIKHYRSFSLHTVRDPQNCYKTGHDNMIAGILDYIHENYQSKIQLEDIAKGCYLNKRYVNRIFKEVTGYSIIQYLIQYRIEKAKRLLAFTSISITELGMELGFCDCQHFCRTFKRVEGMTPMDYRKSKKNSKH